MIDVPQTKKILEEKFPNFKIIYKEEYFEIYTKKMKFLKQLKKLKKILNYVMISLQI